MRVTGRPRSAEAGTSTRSPDSIGSVGLHPIPKQEAEDNAPKETYCREHKHPTKGLVCEKYHTGPIEATVLPSLPCEDSALRMSTHHNPPKMTIERRSPTDPKIQYPFHPERGAGTALDPECLLFPHECGWSRPGA